MKTLSLFNNFSATNFKLLPTRNKAISDILNPYYESILKHVKTKTISIVGYYQFDVLNNKNISIEYILPVQSTHTYKYKNYIIDSWFCISDWLYDDYKNKSTTFILTQKYIEELEDPRPLLLGLKKCLLKDKTKNELYLVLGNSEHGYRNWTQQQLIEFLNKAGFYIICLENNLYKITCTEKSCKKSLELLGLNSEFFYENTLFVYGEDASLCPTGGIGTYIKNMRLLNPNLILLFCDIWAISKIPKTNKFIDPYHILGNVDWTNFIDGIGLIECVRTLLFVLPRIEIIEFQDYQSIGFRIVQSKKAGLIPNSVWLRVFTHGNIDYLT